MKFPIPSEENEHLSKYLNAFEKSLPLVKFNQYYMRCYNEIVKIIYDILGSSTCLEAIVGSTAEGLSVLGSDIDYIMFPDDFKVFDSRQESHNLDLEQFQFLRIPDEGHPGYSKLCVISLDIRFGEDYVKRYTYEDLTDGNVYLKNNVKELVYYSDNSIDYNTHGPAHCHEFDQQKFEAIFKPDKPHTFEIKNTKNADFVLCVRCKQWPVEATEWTTRRRASNWPTNEIFPHIINTGCLLAGVGSKESKESEIQWRVSFNEAEQLIIASLNETQIHCILLLKILKNNFLYNIAGKNITSYTMKTVMFWCLDETSGEYWQSSNLVSCFCFCVSKLKSFVERGFLPNYFIRKRNQFVAKEFTCDIRNKTRKDLEYFLNHPTACIDLLLPSYRQNANTEISKFNAMSQIRFIEQWLKNKVSMAVQYQFNFWNRLLKLYNGYSIEGILKRCNEALEKLNTSIKTKPLINKLLNYMGVLHYILLMEERETVEHRADSYLRERYSKYTELSATGDLTHSTLRIATCYLDDGVKEDCLNTIRTVTDDENYFMQLFSERVEQTLTCDIEALRKKKHNTHEINMYNDIIYGIDFIYQDPYRTIAEFQKLKESRRELIGYDSLSLVWKRCYFDVTFMLAELPVLPKPAALELCVENSRKYISFHPYLYGLLLEFLWYVKYSSGNKEKESVLEKMESCVSKMEDEKKSIGYNFMTYCYSLQKDYRIATRYLLQSFNLNHVKQNVAYLYIKYILTLLRLALSDDNDDHSVWLNVHGIEWNID